MLYNQRSIRNILCLCISKWPYNERFTFCVLLKIHGGARTYLGSMVFIYFKKYNHAYNAKKRENRATKITI